MRSLQLLFRTLGHFKPRFFCLFAIGLVDGVLSFTIPVLLAEFTRGEFSLERFYQLSIWIAIVHAVTLGVEWIMRKYGESLGPQYGLYLREKYFKAVEGLSVSDLTRHHSGYVLSLIGSVSGGLTLLANELLWGFTGLLSTLVLFFVFTARESLFIALLNGVVLVIFVIIGVMLSRRMVEIAREKNESQAKLTQVYVDCFSNILTVIKLGIQSFVEGIIRKRTAEVQAIVQKAQNFHAARWFILHGLFGLVFVLTICFLLSEIAHARATPAVLILFVTALSGLRRNLAGITENARTLMELDAYLSKLDEIVTLNHAPTQSEVETSWEKISFSDVRFHYPESAVEIVIPSFTLKRGQIIGISGESGQGKTTFLHLLANLRSPNSGTRLMDDRDYRDLPSGLFTQTTLLVSQEAELFNLSVFENLTLGKNISEETIFKMLEAVSLQGWLKEQSEGLNTQVGEKGVRLSSGQKQRLNLIRAFLIERELYLLDEPTAHIDTQTEERVVKFIADHLRGKTGVIVSHRDIFSSICDARYVIHRHRLERV